MVRDLAFTVIVSVLIGLAMESPFSSNHWIERSAIGLAAVSLRVTGIRCVPENWQKVSLSTVAATGISRTSMETMRES